jgi:hypothetical protein
VHPLCALTRRQVLSIGKRLMAETAALGRLDGPIAGQLNDRDRFG